MSLHVTIVVDIDYKENSMHTIAVQNIVWKEGKYYVAQCLNVDVSSFGKTKKEALKNIEEALELYFEDAPRASITRVEHPVVVRQQLQHA